jgi:hypothetical protein
MQMSVEENRTGAGEKSTPKLHHVAAHFCITIRAS